MLHADVHHSHEELHHNHEKKCIECLYNETNSNYLFDNIKVDFSNNYYSIFISHTIESESLSINQRFRSRAPPIS